MQKLLFQMAPDVADKGPSEATIQSHIMARLRQRRYMVVRFNGGGFKKNGQFVFNYIIQGLNSSKGFPDVVAFKDGRCYLIEVKTKTGRLSLFQRNFRDYAVHFGTSVHVVRSVDELDELLDKEEARHAAAHS